MKKFVKFLGIILFLFATSTTFFSVYKTAISYQPDFSIFYLSAKDILHGMSPYTDRHLFTAFNYPIVTTIFFIPFTIFPHIVAQILFTCISTFALFLSIVIAGKLVDQKMNRYVYLFIASLALLAFPTKFTFGMGQVNIIAYTALLLGFLLYTKTKQKSALVFLVIAILLKPILGFTLVIFLFERKAKYFFILLFIIVFLMVLFPVVLGQPSSNFLFISSIFNQNLSGREVYYNQGLLGFISRTTSNLTLRSIFNSVGTIGIVSFALVKLKILNFVEKISILLTLLLLIDPLSWQHHFVFLLLPFITVGLAIQKCKSSKPIYYLLYAISYMLVAWNFKMPQLLHAFPLSLLLSTQFYGTLLLFILQLVLL